MKIPVYNQNAEKVSEAEVSVKVFGVKAKPEVLAEVTRIQQMNQRSSRSHTKTRGDVSGTGKKPWKQKGTGRARAGSTRSPLWRHGGVTFGPSKDRNWHRDLNKQVKQLALRMALSDKLASGKLVVLSEVDLVAPKTKIANSVLTNFRKADLGVGKKPLVVLPDSKDTLVRSFRNIAGVQVISAKSLNALPIVSADSLIVFAQGLPLIETFYGKDSE